MFECICSFSFRVFRQNKVADDGGEDPEFSDDEAERQYVQKQKAKNRGPFQSSFSQSELISGVLDLIFCFSATG